MPEHSGSCSCSLYHLLASVQKFTAQGARSGEGGSFNATLKVFLMIEITWGTAGRSFFLPEEVNCNVGFSIQYLICEPSPQS